MAIDWDPPPPKEPITFEVTEPPHADMPTCAKCGRPVDGIVDYWPPFGPFEITCHGMVTWVMRAADGELPTGLVLFQEGTPS